MKRYFYVLLVSLLYSASAVSQLNEQELIISPLTNVESAVPADIDMDGDDDVVVIDNDHVSWFENLSVGTFGVRNIISGAIDEGTVVIVADLNGDSLIDVISGSMGDDKIAWYENLGEGKFGSQQLITTMAWNPSDLTTADLDNDGDLDLISSSTTDDEIAWYENDGAGGFGSQIIVSTLVNDPSGVVAFDVNGDSNIDIVSTSQSDDKLAWYENLGGGSFGTQQIISSTIDGPTSLDFGDLNGDGNFDLVCSAYYSESVWFENLGGGAFGTATSISSSLPSWDVQLTDFDGDLDLDVLLGTFDSKIVVCENDGTGSIIFETEITTSLNSFCVRSADFNLDGSPDILTAFGWSGLRWYRQESTFSFGSEANINSYVNTPRSTHAADINNDGQTDLILTDENQVVLFDNFENGKFATPRLVDEYLSGAGFCTTVDFDQDEDIDIIASAFVGDHSEWYENTGDGLFNTGINFTLAINGAQSVHPIDLDLDGDLDAVVEYVLVSGSKDKITWYENLGDLVFAPKSEIVDINPVAHSLTLEDFDGDGDHDMVCVSGSEILWFEHLGVGSATFGPETILDDGLGQPRLISSDVDSDGDLDIVFLANYGLDLRWYENPGDGSFAAEQTIATFSGYGGSRLSEANLNDDGYPDYVTTDNDQIVFINSVDGTSFEEPVYVSAIATDIVSHSTSDFDNDGDDDLIYASEWDEKLVICKNEFYDLGELRGKLFYDENQNGTLDSGEVGLPLTQVITDPSSGLSYTRPDGRYSVEVVSSAGTTLNVFPEEVENWSITTSPTEYSVLITPDFLYEEDLDFGFFMDDSVTNLVNVDLTGGFPRCNSTINYWLYFENMGTTQPSGVISLDLNENITYQSASIAPDSIVDQTIYWSYDSLYYFESGLIIVQVEMPGIDLIGDTLASTLGLYVDSLGSITYSAESTLEQVLVCSYDPNDKIVYPKGETELGYIPFDTDILTYTVRFQNTGNDTAITVRIHDELNDNLIPASLEPIASSHPMTVNFDYTGKVIFEFENIMLPDSNVNEPASHGFAKFRVNLQPDLPEGTTILNQAQIYFDANPPIITNTTINTLDSIEYDYSSIEKLEPISGESVNTYKVYPNPFKDQIFIEMSQANLAGYNFHIYNIQGKELQKSYQPSGNLMSIRTDQLSNGIYILSVVDLDNGQRFSTTVCKQ